VTGAGSTDLKRHLAGKDLTPLQAIKAKCADCTANYTDGRVSCELKECPLFPYHPYNPSRRRSRTGKPRVRELGRISEGASVEPLLEEEAA
jgi:hypothetical protein